MKRMTTWVAVCLVAAMALGAAGCSNDKRTPDEKFKAYLEEGNAAFKAKKYDVALKAYKKATELQGVTQGSGAGYYGVSMAYDALGKHDEAKQALAKAGELSPGLAAPHGAMEASGAMGGMGGANPHAGMNMDSTGAGGMGDMGGGGGMGATQGDSGWVTRGR